MWRRNLGDVDVTAAQSKAGFAFPVVVEAVDPLELDRTEGVDEQAEHAAAADRRELLRVTDEHDPPALDVGEVGQLGELGGRQHAGLVDHTVVPTGGRSGERVGGRGGVR